ncbi:hypothetical protein D3C87_1416050 [compost metagenome]
MALLALQQTNCLHTAFGRQRSIGQQHPLGGGLIPEKKTVNRRAQSIGIRRGDHRAVTLFLLELMNHEHEIGERRFAWMRAQRDVTEHFVHDDLVSNAKWAHW